MCSLVMNCSSLVLLLYCKVLRVEECVQNQFVLLDCGKVEVKSRLKVDSRLTLQLFSQESFTLCFSWVICPLCEEMG